MQCHLASCSIDVEQLAKWHCMNSSLEILNICLEILVNNVFLL